MRSFTILAGLASLASAQMMPVSDIAAMGAPAPKSAPGAEGAGSDLVPYDSQSVATKTYQSVYAGANSASSKLKRTKRSKLMGRTVPACGAYPLGSGPIPNPDTDIAFLADTDFSNAALNAVTPTGWTNVFTNLQASVSSPMGYLGYDSLASYNVDTCTANCLAKDGCMAVNIFFERDPSLNPDTACPNPPSTTVIKCVYWGVMISADLATQTGQYRNDFHSVNAGSNGYVFQTVPSLPGYTGTPVGNASINAPTECNSYITYKMWNDGLPFDPARCAAACDAESQYNIDHLCSRSICRFFDTYILLANGVPQGQYCALYTRSWDVSYATNFGQWNTDHSIEYTIKNSYIYSNNSDPGSTTCNSQCMSQDPCPTGCTSSSSSTTLASSTTTSWITSSTDSTTTTTTTASSWTTTTTTTTLVAPTTTTATTTTTTSSTTTTTTTTPVVPTTTTTITTTISTTTTTTTATKSTSPVLPTSKSNSITWNAWQQTSPSPVKPTSKTTTTTTTTITTATGKLTFPPLPSPSSPPLHTIRWQADRPLLALSPFL